MYKKIFSLLLIFLLLAPSLVACMPLEEEDEFEPFEYDENGFRYMHNGDGTFTLASIPADAPAEISVDFYKGRPITRIAENLFRDNLSLTSITLGDMVREIGSSAFSGCTSLKEVRGGRGLIKIEHYAFSGCTALTNAPIPQGILSLGDFCFGGCPLINLASLPDSLIRIGNKIFGESFSCVASTTYENALYPSCNDNPYYYLYSPTSKDITSVSLHPDTRVIMGSAFKSCTELYLVDLGEHLERICDEAFWRCSALESITIPQSTLSIGDSAFRSCASLSNVILGDNLLSLGNSTFRDCERLVTYHYKNATYLASQTNPYYALLNVNGTEISSIEIHPSTKLIGNSVFSDCENLHSVSLPDGLLAIDNDAFSGSGLRSITIPSGVRHIGRDAFRDCEKLASASIGNGVTIIEDSAFQNCVALKTIVVPDSVKEIGEAAFAYCESLISVTIGASVTYISEAAFEDCLRLATVINKSALNIVTGAYAHGQVARHAKIVLKA